MRKNTKSALLLSVVSIIVCCTMLLGTTMAWFTDSVTSDVNKIIAGNLDVELTHKNKSVTTDTAVDGSTKLFTDVALWEPGAVVYETLTVSNAGTLALKYKLTLDVLEVTTVTVDDVTYDLTDVIKVGLTTKDVSGGRAQAVEAVGDEWLDLADFEINEQLDVKDKDLINEIDETDTVTVVLYWEPSDNDNIFNLSNGKTASDSTNELKLNLGVTLVATQLAAESDSFNNQYDAEAEYPVVGTIVTASNIASIDFTEENKKFVFRGTFDAVTISELGDGSVIDFDNATVGALTLQDDAELTGTATLASFNARRDSADTPIEITFAEANVDINGNVNVENTLGKSILNIKNSSFECAFLSVGTHVNNNRGGLAEFNVANSYLRCEENSLGSTISVWGRSGVKSTIYDSEIHTYSRGWHSSEDANDNAITFQGATSIDVDIQRSNIHTYGYRSIINARQYGSETTTVNASIDDSLIWVVTKSTHNPETIPVWGFNSITDTALVFTKNVTASVDQVVDSSFIYGNPVIHGNFNLHSNCNCSWNAHVALDDETVTFAADANVSVDDACNGSLNFVLSDSAKIVVEDGATVSGKVNIVAADGYTLNNVTENGVTTYSVSAN